MYTSICFRSMCRCVYLQHTVYPLEHANRVPLAECCVRQWLIEYEMVNVCLQPFHWVLCPLYDWPASQPLFLSLPTTTHSACQLIRWWTKQSWALNQHRRVHKASYTIWQWLLSLCYHMSRCMWKSIQPFFTSQCSLLTCTLPEAYNKHNITTPCPQ